MVQLTSEAAGGREAEADNFFSQIWAYGVCYYGLLNAPSRMGIILTASEAAKGREAEAEIFFPDMGMWGILLWVIEYTESNGHGLDGL